MVITVEEREAKIGKLAPDFCCTAVDDEEFVDIKLSWVAKIVCDGASSFNYIADVKQFTYPLNKSNISSKYTEQFVYINFVIQSNVLLFLLEVGLRVRMLTNLGNAIALESLDEVFSYLIETFLEHILVRCNSV